MKIHHIGYLVKKIDKAVEAFEDLGFQLKQEKMYDEYRKIYIVFMEKDGYVAELVSPVGKDSVVAGLIKQYHNAPYHLCYSSDEFDKDLKYLSQHGYVQMDEPCIAPALGNGRVVFLMSPVIGMVELYEKNKGGGRDEEYYKKLSLYIRFVYIGRRGGYYWIMNNLKITCFGGVLGFYARRFIPKLGSSVYLTYLRETTKKDNRNYIDKVMQMDKIPLAHINLETINRCNGDCPFCPNNKYVNKRRLERMTDQTFEKLIDDLSENGYRGVLSMQGNGEPFLDKDMPDRIEYAREKLPNTELIIFTNGTLLTEKILEKIAGKLDVLYINNYCETYKLNDHSKMVFDYYKKNQEKFRNMKIQIEYRYKNEVLTTRGGVSPNKYNDTKIYKSLCVLPYMETYIFSDGSVGLCCCDVNKTFNFGNIREKSIFDVFNDKKIQSIREKIINGRNGLDFCKYCDFESKGGRRLKWLESEGGNLL